MEDHLPNMSKKPAPKKAITTKEKDILDDAPQKELSAFASEERDMEHFPITTHQTVLTDCLMTILEMMERKNADKEEKWHEEERRKRMEEREKEERRREEEEKREERRERIYREEAKKREMRLLELLESKDKAITENQLRLFEKNKKLKSVPTWKENDTPADYLRRFEQVMLSNEEPKDQWARIQSIHLSGKASTVFSTRIPTDKQNYYEIVKTVLLDAFGDTVDMARQQ